MQIPRVLREQIREYERAGFHVIKWEQRNGAHFKLWFAEFDEPQIVTKNIPHIRALLNNISRYRRLAAAKGSNDGHD